MCEYFPCMSNAYRVHAWCQRPENDFRTSGIASVGGCQLLCGTGEPTQGPLQDELKTEPFPSPCSRLTCPEVCLSNWLTSCSTAARGFPEMQKHFGLCFPLQIKLRNFLCIDRAQVFMSEAKHTRGIKVDQSILKMNI